MRRLLKPLFLMVLLCIQQNVFAQASSSGSQSALLSPGYYVVVGAYASSKESIAKNFADALKAEGFSASYGFNSSRRMYLVYLSFFDNLKGSLMEMQRVRKQSKFGSAWVRVIPGDIRPILTTKPMENQEVPPTNVDALPETEPSAPMHASDSIVVTDNEEIKQYAQVTLGNTEVFLSLFQQQNNRIVDGEIEVIDKDRQKTLTRVKGNEYLMLPDPKSKSGQLTLVCDVFGYKKLIQEINYPIPLADTVKPYIDLMGTTLVVNFDMKRYQKGDKTTLDHVFFYNDAAVMQPESRKELESLALLLREEPGIRIRLHGHTNGNYNGKIIKTGPGKNFFSLDGTENTTGSARDLSQYRAEAIRDFLVLKGVDGSRIEIKPWGGKKPLHDRNGANARKNVRVELEVL